MPFIVGEKVTVDGKSGKITVVDSATNKYSVTYDDDGSIEDDIDSSKITKVLPAASSTASTAPAEDTVFQTEFKDKKKTIEDVETLKGRCAVPIKAAFGGGKSRKPKKRGSKHSLKKSKKSNKSQKKNRKSRGKK